MIFRVSNNPDVSTFPCVVLIHDNWNDYWKFVTMFNVSYYDTDGIEHEIGQVKIGQFNMKEERPEIPDEFKLLDDRFFSLGQNRSYYENLDGLGADLRSEILKALNDLSIRFDLYDRAINEEVTRISLLRNVNKTLVKGQFHRLATGGAKLTAYSFNFHIEDIFADVPPVHLTFDVVPKSNPPTNIHVLIGRNGVGKTYLLVNMISSLLDENSPGEFSSDLVDDPKDLFAGLVWVSFSAFDRTHPPAERRDNTKGVRFSYVGLKVPKKRTKENSSPPKNPDDLTTEFLSSFWNIKNSGKAPLWLTALENLSADPVFNDENIVRLEKIQSEPELREKGATQFNQLSSGHKIVLLTMTRLVETVEERTLVLIDEPEAHLHPPLLSALIRALSELLINRNGVAIIATHSPVVLQEVPKSCVWRLRRNGNISISERLETESFGENVGVLTSEVFGLEVSSAGFHKLLSDLIVEYDTYESLVEALEGQVGMEGKAIIRGLLNTKNNHG